MAKQLTKTETVFKCEKCEREFEIEELANLCEKRDKEMGKWFKKIYDIILSTEESLRRELTDEERHQIHIIFCKGFAEGLSISQTQIKDILLIRDLYFKLNIPTEQLVLEHMRKGIFMGFPFFLRKVDNNENGEFIHAITIHDYPKARKATFKMQSNGQFPILADEKEEIILSDENIDKLLSQGFNWYHESERNTLR